MAVVGASRDPSKVGGSVLANLRSAGFAGRVIPINARADVVQGLPALPSLLDVSEPVDLAVIALPAAAVLDGLKQCAAKGVGGAVVISAGFREIGAAGAEREAELREWLRTQSLRVLGPNCLGWIRPSRRLNVSFAPGTPDPGGIAFVSHSGALAVAILDWSRARRLGFSLFASLGNQADLNESDVLDAATEDPETRVIAAYLEGVADGRRFLDALRRAAAVKPVVVLKTGRSAEGAKAVSSHTGAMAGSDRAFDAAVRAAGAVRVETVAELFDLARALAVQPVPRGRRVAILTNGGGLGIVSADAARATGLRVDALPESSRLRLAESMPPTASLANPVDLVGDADAARYSRALHGLGPTSADAALVILTAQAATDPAGVARAVIGATRGWPIPVVAALVGGASVAPGVRTLEDAGIPCYEFPEPAIRSLAGMALIAERRRRPAPAVASARPAMVADWLVERRRRGRAHLGFAELAPLLTAYDIPCAAMRAARDAAEAAVAAAALGYPVAMKVMSPDITHKSDVGGVMLHLRDAAAVRAAATAMLERAAAVRPPARVDGLLLQPMVRVGAEMLVGLVRDAQFGPLLMVGGGGVYVEVLGDTAARLAPVSIAEAEAMLGELRMAPVLAGIRGEAPVDRAALARAVAALSRLGADVPELAEIEINPLMASPDGVVAVDARARLDR
ncbi:MAG TPA: acetate--CoA ligase family protein [Methylomirabilota bacterium]|nr:acetate--CoA ligase family protein [Methylomirabilota bacterium]